MQCPQCGSRIPIDAVEGRIVASCRYLGGDMRDLAVILERLVPRLDKLADRLREWHALTGPDQVLQQLRRNEEHP